MKILVTADELRSALSDIPPSASLGFVPTMGGLHEGHAALIRASVSRCSKTIVSIFVNPAQFAPHEDLAAYPRTLASDLELCKTIGVHLVFTPDPRQFYPPGYCTHVETDVGNPATNPSSEGAARPIFFRGVATVLTKLFILVTPSVVFFGQKDAQQCAVVRRLVNDLGFHIEVVICDTVRDADGLAMSTRNAYLTPYERPHANVLFQALCKADLLAQQGVRDPNCLRKAIQTHVQFWELHHKPSQTNFQLLYVSVCSATTMLEFISDVPQDEECIACIAGMMGKTRLIDNIKLQFPQAS